MMLLCWNCGRGKLGAVVGSGLQISGPFLCYACYRAAKKRNDRSVRAALGSRRFGCIEQLLFANGTGYCWFEIFNFKRYPC